MYAAYIHVCPYLDRLPLRSYTHCCCCCFYYYYDDDDDTDAATIYNYADSHEHYTYSDKIYRNQCGALLFVYCLYMKVCL